MWFRTADGPTGIEDHRAMTWNLIHCLHHLLIPADQGIQYLESMQWVESIYSRLGKPTILPTSSPNTCRPGHTILRKYAILGIHHASPYTWHNRVLRKYTIRRNNSYNTRRAYNT